jgi:hypothetical protein
MDNGGYKGHQHRTCLYRFDLCGHCPDDLRGAHRFPARQERERAGKFADSVTLMAADAECARSQMRSARLGGRVG